jgi:hypothetical protein
MNRIEELQAELQAEYQAQFKKWSEEMEEAKRQLEELELKQKEIQQKQKEQAPQPPTPPSASGIIPVPRINNVILENLFYDPDNKNFYELRYRKKTQAQYLRKIAWNTLHPKYIDKNGELKTYTYRFALIPHKKKYVRIKEGELERYLAEERGELML